MATSRVRRWRFSILDSTLTPLSEQLSKGKYKKIYGRSFLGRFLLPRALGGPQPGTDPARKSVQFA